MSDQSQIDQMQAELNRIFCSASGTGGLTHRLMGQMDRKDDPVSSNN